MAENLPDVLPPVTDESLQRAGLPSRMEMSPGLAIFFDDALYQRCKNIAKLMSAAASMAPAHLRDKPEACFAVVSRSIVWKLDPFAVAMSTYQTPGGSIGYEGKLIQAILEMSGRIEGQIRFTHNGDWSKLRRKFKMKAGASGKEYPVPTWTPEDAEGLSVTVAAKIKGEQEDRTLEVWLESCWPLNSPLWATDPRRQICYTAVRAFANMATPSLLFGIPFDVDPTGLADMRDITPEKPQASEFRQEISNNPALAEWITKANFCNKLTEVGDVRAAGLKALSPDVHVRFEEICDARARQITNAQQAVDLANQQVEQEEEQPDREDAHKGESPFQRGQRLLAIITAPADVLELYNSILEELTTKKDKTLWKQTCQARFAELGGVGLMTTVPK